MNDPWKRLINTLQRRMVTDWDNMIGLQGERGSGKSTLALRVALALRPDFKPENVFYDPDDWTEVVKGPPRQVFILDEGTNIAFNRTWQQKSQVKLVQLLNTIRQRNHTFIWCAPNLERMDTVIRGDILKYRLSTLHRGLAVLHQRHYDWERGEGRWVKLGRIKFASLEWHPIWEPYTKQKAASYSASVKATEKPRGRTAEELAAIRPPRDPITHKFTKRIADPAEA